jgi:hypothetical protein
LIDHLFGAEREARDWFRRWLAYPLQRPGTKLFSAALLWGKTQGTGKSLVGYTLFRIYGKNAAEISGSDLHAGFNEWIVNKQFIMADEIVGGEIKRNTADKMKSMITQKELRINRKYVPAYTVPDCVNYLFTSNHADAFFMEDTDRRFMIHEVLAAPKSKEFYREYAAWLYKDGASALFQHFLDLDLTEFDPAAAALQTAAKREMTELGQSDIKSWAILLRDNPNEALRQGPTGTAVQGDTFDTSALLQIYNDPFSGRRPTSLRALGVALKEAGLEKVNGGQQLKATKEEQRTGYAHFNPLWAVRNLAELAKMGVRELYEHHHAQLIQFNRPRTKPFAEKENAAKYKSKTAPPYNEKEK